MKKFALLLIVLLAACDVTPTEPLTAPDARPAASQASVYSGLDINDATWNHDQDGYNEYVSFADTDGNWYYMELLFDGYGRQTAFRVWYNSEYLGADIPQWSGMTRTHHVTVSPSAWAMIGPDGQPNNFGLISDPIGGGGGNPCPPELCLGAMYYAPVSPDIAYANCRDRFSGYMWNSAGLLGTFLILGGTVIASEIPPPNPSTPFLVRGAALLFAFQARNWYGSVRELDNCVRALGNGGNAQ